MRIRTWIWGRRRRALLGGVGLTALAAAVSLVAVSSAGGAPEQPVLSLGPVSVSNGVATFSGSVASGGTTALELTVNGQPIGVDASGSFQATIGLGSSSQLVISAKNPATGERFTLTIPLSIAGPGGTISDPLSLLRQAGISITIPPGGFSVLDGQPLRVTGRVLEPDSLSSFTVNGREILGAIGPSGVFSERVSSESREVAVSATDSRGVSQSSTFPVAQISSVIQTPAGQSVSAVGARGLRIASVRYVTKGIAKTRRLQIVVTVHDFRKLLVRGAIVTIKGAPRARPTIGGRQVKLTNSLGQAKFNVKLRPEVFSKRLYVSASARTPNARAEKLSAVRLPKLSAKASARET